MIRKLKYYIPLIGLLVVSCTKDFLNVNTDPNNPTSIEVGKLLSTAQRTLGDALSMDENNGGLSEILAVYTHQMTTREEADKYGITGVDPFIQTPWSKLYSQTANPGSTFPVYGVLQNLEDIIKNASAAGNMRYVGIAIAWHVWSFVPEVSTRETHGDAGDWQFFINRFRYIITQCHFTQAIHRGIIDLPLCG